jgi:ribosome-associated protein
VEGASLPGEAHDLSFPSGVAKLMSQPGRSSLAIGSRPINLTQVLKRAGWVMSGGEAKSLIADGQVRVNGEVELRKRRQMKAGDLVTLEDGPSVELRSGD